MPYGNGSLYGFGQYGNNNFFPALTGLLATDLAYIPKNFQVALNSATSLTLTWSQPDNAVSGYRIFGSPYWDGEWVPIGSTRNLTYIDSGLKSNSSYYYVVKSIY